MAAAALGDPLSNPEQLLAEVDDLLRTSPHTNSRDGADEERLIWIGRAATALDRWDHTRWLLYTKSIEDAQRPTLVEQVLGLRTLRVWLYRAQADLRFTAGRQGIVLPQGHTFDYFEEVRKVVEAARLEVFFVDGYLDAEFVSRYVSRVAKGTAVRLLTHPKSVADVREPVELLCQQSGLSVSVRTSSSLHDRFVFIDRQSCYFSGASFKDGAKNAPTLLAQLRDIFQPVWDAYEAIWQKAHIER
jgi:hypothetical protein